MYIRGKEDLDYQMEQTNMIYKEDSQQINSNKEENYETGKEAARWRKKILLLNNS